VNKNKENIEWNAKSIGKPSIKKFIEINTKPNIIEFSSTSEDYNPNDKLKEETDTKLDLPQNIKEAENSK